MDGVVVVIDVDVCVEQSGGSGEEESGLRRVFYIEVDSHDVGCEGRKSNDYSRLLNHDIEHSCEAVPKGERRAPRRTTQRATHSTDPHRPSS